MQSKSINGIRWGVFAAGCASLAACGGGSTGGGGGGSGSGNFTTTAVANPVTGGEAALDVTDVQKVLAAGLAVLATADGIYQLGIAGFDSGAAPAPAQTDDCGAGTVTTEISEGGADRTFTQIFDQCYFNSSPDFLFDGRYSQISTEVGSNIEGRLEVGQGPTPGVLVFQDGSALRSIQLLSTGGALTFEGSSSGSPFDVTLTSAAMVVARGARPAEGGAYVPQRGFGLLVGTDAPLEIHTVVGTTVAHDMSGTLSFRGSGMNAACNFNASVGVATGAGDPVRLDDSGRGVGGSMTLDGAGGTAQIVFLADGTAQVTPAGGGAGVEFDPSEVAALCNL